jgi:hypothetical protein
MIDYFPKEKASSKAFSFGKKEIYKMKNVDFGNWNTLNELEYSINYPTDWELSQNGLLGTEFILFSPLESNQDKFRENVSLYIQNFSGQNLDLNKFVEISLEQCDALLTSFVLIENVRENIGSDEFHRVVCTYEQGKYQLKGEQYCWIKNDQSYVLTLSCGEDTFLSYKEVGEEILKSFKLK